MDSKQGEVIDIICSLYERWISNLALQQIAESNRQKGRFGIAVATDEEALRWQDLDAKNRAIKKSIEELRHPANQEVTP